MKLAALLFVIFAFFSVNLHSARVPLPSSQVSPTSVAQPFLEGAIKNACRVCKNRVATDPRVLLTHVLDSHLKEYLTHFKDLRPLIEYATDPVDHFPDSSLMTQCPVCQFSFPTLFYTHLHQLYFHSQNTFDQLHFRVHGRRKKRYRSEYENTGSSSLEVNSGVIDPAVSLENESTFDTFEVFGGLSSAKITVEATVEVKEESTVEDKESSPSQVTYESDSFEVFDGLSTAETREEATVEAKKLLASELDSFEIFDNLTQE